MAVSACCSRPEPASHRSLSRTLPTSVPAFKPVQGSRPKRDFLKIPLSNHGCHDDKSFDGMILSDRVDILLERTLQGDPGAASELVELHYEAIYAFLRRLSGSDDEASDLTQRTFMKAWTTLSSFSGRSRFSTWLHGIAHHVYVDWRRRRRTVETRHDEWWKSVASRGATPFQEAADRDAARTVYAHVDRLDSEHRATIHLHYYQGLSIADTAEAMKVASSTVKYRLRAALDILRSKLGTPRTVKGGYAP